MKISLALQASRAEKSVGRFFVRAPSSFELSSFRDFAIQFKSDRENPKERNRESDTISFNSGDKQ